MKNDEAKTHTAMVVVCITALGVLGMLCGVFLIWKGYQTGELYAQIGSNALSGLIGFISGAGTVGALKAAGATGKTRITNSPDDPVPVTPTEETK